MASGLAIVIRRAFLALLAGVLAALAIRLRGKGGVPPQTGGWRELSAEELTDSAWRPGGPDS